MNLRARHGHYSATSIVVAEGNDPSPTLYQSAVQTSRPNHIDYRLPRDRMFGPLRRGKR